MRITYCPKGHRVELDEHANMLHSPEEAVDCDYCKALRYQKRPVKAKRPGES